MLYFSMSISIASTGNTPTWDGTSIKLCVNDRDISGVMYARNKQSVIDGWSTTFTFQVDDPGLSVGYGDGISFIIQNNALTAMTAGTGNFGGDTIPNSLSIQFGTYYEYIRVRSTSSSGTTMTVGTQLDTSAFDDGNLHTVTILYEPSNALIFVYVDAMTPYVVVCTPLTHTLTRSIAISSFDI
jgi:hypothetical protein